MDVDAIAKRVATEVTASGEYKELVAAREVMGVSMKGRWLELLDDVSNAIAIHARKQGNKKVLSRITAPVKEIRALINELD